MQITFK